MPRTWRNSGRARAAPQFFVAGPSKRVISGETTKATPTKAAKATPAKATPGKAAQQRKTRKAQQRRSKDSALLAALRDKNASLVQAARDVLGDEQVGRQLVLLLLEACGVPESGVLRGLSEQDLDSCDFTLTEDTLPAFCEDVAADCATYPYGRDAQTREALDRFWALVAVEGGAGLLSEANLRVVECLCEAMEVLSRAPLLAMRHTCVAAAGSLATGLTEAMHEQVGKLDKTLKQMQAKVRNGEAALQAPFAALRQALETFVRPGRAALDLRPVQAALASWTAAADASSAAGPLAPLAAACTKLTRAITHAGELANDLVANVLAERYLDARPVVRQACAAALSRVTAADVSRYLPKAKIYLERLLRDRDAGGRASACEALRVVMAANSADQCGLAAGRGKAEVQEKVRWARRCKATLTETLLRDREPRVARKALEALRAIRAVDAGLLDLGDEREVERSLCYEAASDPDAAKGEDVDEIARAAEARRARLEAARLVLETQEALRGPSISAAAAGTDDDDGDGNDDDDDDDDGDANMADGKEKAVGGPASAAKSRRKSQARASLGDAAQAPQADGTSAGAIARARLELSSLVDLMGNLMDNRTSAEAEGEHGGAPPKLLLLPAHQVALVVDALASVPGGEFLRNFEAMTSMLLSYGETDLTGALGQHKAKAVASVLRAACEHAASEPAEPAAGKREQRALEARRDALLARLQDALERRLADCLAAFRSEPVVLRDLLQVLQHLDPAKCTKDLARAGVERIVKTLAAAFAQHRDPALLFGLASALRGHLGAGSHPLQREALSALAQLESEAVAKLKRAARSFLADAGSGGGGGSGGDLVEVLGAVRRGHVLARLADEPLPVDAGLRLDLKNLVRALTDQPLVEQGLCVVTEVILFSQLSFMHGLHALAGLVSSASKPAADKEDEEELSAEADAFLGDVLERQRLVIDLLEAALSGVEDGSITAQTLLPAYHDMRSLCTIRLRRTVLHRLAWRPSERLASAMRAAAQASVARVQAAQSTAPKAALADVEAVRKAVLLPAARTAAFGGDRREAGELSQLVLDPFGAKVARAPALEQAAEEMDDTLRRCAPLEWAAAVLLCLQRRFESVVVLAAKGRELEAEEESLDEDVDTLPALRQRVAAFVKEHVSSRKRMCPERLAPAVVELVTGGARFALTSPRHLAFLDQLCPFVATLKGRHINNLRVAWEQAVAAAPADTAKAVFKGRRSAKNKSFLAFEKLLGVSTVAAGAQDDDDDDDEEEEVSDGGDATMTPGKAKTPGKTKTPGRTRTPGKAKTPGKARTPGKSETPATTLSRAERARRRSGLSEGKLDEAKKEEEDKSEEDDASTKEIEKNLYDSGAEGSVAKGSVASSKRKQQQEEDADSDTGFALRPKRRRAA